MKQLTTPRILNETFLQEHCLEEKVYGEGQSLTDTKVHLYRTYILPVLLYGCETWTVSKTLAKRLDAFDTRCLRKIFMDSVHQAHYKWHSQEHHGLLASLWKGQVIRVEVFRAPGSISSRAGPPPCHRRRAATSTWLAEPETSWPTKIHLAESDRRGRSAPELWGPHGLEEGKGKGYLASSRQYGNALLGVRHKKKKSLMIILQWVSTRPITGNGWEYTALYSLAQCLKHVIISAFAGHPICPPPLQFFLAKLLNCIMHQQKLGSYLA